MFCHDEMESPNESYYVTRHTYFNSAKNAIKPLNLYIFYFIAKINVIGIVWYRINFSITPHRMHWFKDLRYKLVEIGSVPRFPPFAPFPGFCIAFFCLIFIKDFVSKFAEFLQNSPSFFIMRFRQYYQYSI